MMWLYVAVLLVILTVNVIALHHLFKERNRKPAPNPTSSLSVAELQVVYMPVRERFRGMPLNTQHEILAVIVEPRPHHNLVSVIKNMQKRIPNIWVIHGSANKHVIFGEFGNTINYVELPVNNLSLMQYNCIMTMPEFYEILPAKHILVFQTDSCVFENSKVNLEDFYMYDYVGAPFLNGGVGNGGLSLRNRETMIRVTRAYDFLPRYENEDLYFYNILRRGEGKLPADNVAAECFFETIDAPNLPFGAHKFLPKQHLGQITKEERSILESY